MRIEDFIQHTDYAFSKSPLPKKHVIAIASTAVIACALYFAVPESKQHQQSNVLVAQTESDQAIISEGTVVGALTDPSSTAAASSSSNYRGMLDPTRPLTDLLSSKKTEYPLQVPSDGSMGQEVYTTASSSRENYDEGELESTAELEVEQEMALAANDGSLENYDEEDVMKDIVLAEAAQEEEAPETAAPYKNLPPVWIAEEIQRGDTLSSIFSDLNIPYSVTLAIAENKDVKGDSLTNLRPGNKLYFCFDEHNNLVGFVKPVNGDEQWRFERQEGEDIAFTAVKEPIGSNIYIEGSDGAVHPLMDEVVVPAYKQRGRLVVAEIGEGESFSVAAHDAGLTYEEISQITKLFSDKVRFGSQIQPGDTLRVLFSDDKGKGKINAVELKLRKLGTLTAFRNLTDDRYYDENGYNTVAASFRRFPIDGKVVISSHFNPNRRHPVTGKVRPHNGTDFAVRVGTPVVAPADGVVELAKYSRSAGYYIILRHRNNYSTVYMHLSKLLVKPGQTVKIGQLIARSGNTGMSTGPHLHYELRRNGRAVNAMRVSLPSTEEVAVAKTNRARFDANVAVFKKELYEPELVAQINTKPQAEAAATKTSTVDEVADVVSSGQKVTAAN